jgi:hypothetical protein
MIVVARDEEHMFGIRLVGHLSLRWLTKVSRRRRYHCEPELFIC